MGQVRGRQPDRHALAEHAPDERRRDSFDTLGQFTAVSGTTFVEVSATYAMGEADSAFLYFESRYPDGTTAPFLVDDITVESQAPPVVEDLTPVKDTVDFPLGSAIDSRETTGASSELLLRHFDQVTPENHMKPEAWYDAAQAFRIHPEAAGDHGLRPGQRDARLRPHARLAQPDARPGSSSTTTARR